MQASQPLEGGGNFASEIAGEVSAMQSSVTDETRENARISSELLQFSLKNEELRIKLQEARHKAKAVRDNRRMRKNYARRALNLAELAFVFWIIVFGVAAIGNLATGKPPFSDKALMTFTAGATVNVFVAFVGIIKGLFPAGTNAK